ncbi:MAG TPA: caspase family protein [Paraburkholderia sp.]|uniref:caspase family protein n=1 Tax=Paraburkholderia sp. TaxID=1926495 RepID=UPI002ED559F0
MPRKRGAVVIGVNQTGGLPVLGSAAAGAEAVADWLSKEGFDVEVITDLKERVTHEMIAEAIKKFVEPGTFSQLVIYFSGHGYFKNNAELWLLSDSPKDANAAVSWIETAEFAKDCGIPHVVLISDACRTIPDSVQALRVRGSIVFPNDDVQRRRAKVDKFMASAMGRAAYEVSTGSDNKSESVFTHCLLSAFRSPDADMIRHVEEDGVDIDVIPNRQLENYLYREVPKFLARISVQLEQRPEADVVSDEDAYVGRALGRPRAVPISLDRSPRTATTSLREVAALEVQRAMEQPTDLSAAKIEVIDRLAQSSGFLNKVAQASYVADVAHFETQTGFAVVGAGVTNALSVNGNRADVVAVGDGVNPGVIRIELAPNNTASSVMLRFANGRGSVLAALRGYIGHVLVEGDQIVNVSYIPSNNSERWREYEQRRARVDRLRATAAAAVRMGIFRLDDQKQAYRLAELIRVGKCFDPVLGLFAAYAYTEADSRDDINSVRLYMQQDLGVDLFDVAMLARGSVPEGTLNMQQVPFCPLLTQGWNFLRSRRIVMPRVLDEAQDELESSLWTTFKPRRAEIIFDAIRRGEIQ